LTNQAVPGSQGNVPDQGKSRINRAEARTPRRLEEPGGVKDGPERPSARAELHLVILPTRRTLIEAVGQILGLTLMGVIAPAATIYAATAARFPAALTAAAVGVELAIACAVARPVMRARGRRRPR
jgi:hypothetical protein